MNTPQAVEKLIILNLPHPQGFMRELANNPEQQRNSQYDRNFQQEGALLNVQQGAADMVTRSIKMWLGR